MLKEARPRVWQGLALLMCALFLASIARFYHPGFGFTGLIAFQTADGSQLPLPAQVRWSTCSGVVTCVRPV